MIICVERNKTDRLGQIVLIYTVGHKNTPNF